MCACTCGSFCNCRHGQGSFICNRAAHRMQALVQHRSDGGAKVSSTVAPCNLPAPSACTSEHAPPPQKTCMRAPPPPPPPPPLTHTHTHTCRRQGWQDLHPLPRRPHQLLRLQGAVTAHAIHRHGGYQQVLSHPVAIAFPPQLLNGPAVSYADQCALQPGNRSTARPPAATTLMRSSPA